MFNSLDVSTSSNPNSLTIKYLSIYSRYLKISYLIAFLYSMLNCIGVIIFEFDIQY